MKKPRKLFFFQHDYETPLESLVEATWFRVKLIALMLWSFGIPDRLERLTQPVIKKRCDYHRRRREEFQKKVADFERTQMLESIAKGMRKSLHSSMKRQKQKIRNRI